MSGLTQVTSDVISTNTISGLISAGFTSMNVATMGTQTIEFGSSNTLVFQANTSLERMRIAANGDIGIGTTTPNSRLTINKNSGSPATIAGSPYFNIVGANADSPRLQFDAYGTGALTLIVFRKANGTLASPSALNSGDQIGNISAWGYGATGYSTTNRGYISFFADEAWTDSAQGTRIVFATSTAGAASAGVERMRITANGDVGIATTAPAQRLHIGLTGANNYIQFGTTNEGFVIGRENATGEFTFDATQASPYNVFRWRQSGTERMRISSTGQLLIGTTSGTGAMQITGASGSRALTLNAPTNGPSLTFEAGGTAFADIGSSTAIFGTGSATDLVIGTRSGYPMIFGTSNTERMRITAGGVLCVGSSSAIGSGAGGISSTVSSSNNISLEKPTGGAIGFYQSGVVTSFIEDVNAQGGLRFYTGTGGSIAERMRILSSGNILSLSGGSTTATGTGIAFPATQSASSDANTLDDYEEGTFTPTFASSGGSITTYNSNGFYIKVGRLVFVQLFCNVTNVGSASGTLNFAGLPFTVNGAFGANQGQIAALIRESNMTGTTYYAYMPGGNSSSGYVTSLSSGGITWSSNGIWPITFTYYTSA